MTAEQEKKKPKIDNTARRLTRLAVVQGLYQIALTGEPVEALVKRFNADPGVFLQEDETLITVDTAMFDTIVSGVFTYQSDLDEMIAGAVDSRLSPDRMEPLLKSIMRAGVFELLHRPEVPAGVIVNDYIDVAHSFFDAKEPGLVNAVLDRLAKKLRS